MQECFNNMLIRHLFWIYQRSYIPFLFSNWQFIFFTKIVCLQYCSLLLFIEWFIKNAAQWIIFFIDLFFLNFFFFNFIFHFSHIWINLLLFMNIAFFTILFRDANSFFFIHIISHNSLWFFFFTFAKMFIKFSIGKHILAWWALVKLFLCA